MNLELIEQKQEAENIISFLWKKPPAVRYQAGEYIELSLDFPNADKRGNRHWFTLSSSPTEDFLMNTTKFPAGKISTFKQHLLKLKPGSQIQVSPPMGDFILPRNILQKIVFVAGGIGITPFRSMLKYMHDKQLAYQIQLIYAARIEAEFAFMELFKNIPSLKLTQIVSEPSPNWSGEVGQLDIQKINKLANGLKEKLVYFSGPESMVEVLDSSLKATGHPHNLVKTDFFPNYAGI